MSPHAPIMSLVSNLTFCCRARGANSTSRHVLPHWEMENLFDRNGDEPRMISGDDGMQSCMSVAEFKDLILLT